MKKSKTICGIYSITNTVNGKQHFGSSLNVWNRKRGHFRDLRNGCHRNRHLQAAWNLYGASNFVFELVTETTSNELRQVEQLYLDRNVDGYNISKCAECAPRGIKWTNESRRKLSKALKGRRLTDEHKKTLSLAGMGRRMTATQRAAVSKRLKGRSIDNATRAKISVAIKTLWKDKIYRNRMLNAQNGKRTKEARKKYSDVMIARWADPVQREAMSAERKSRWSDPVYRAKMLEKRKIQGQKLRERNLSRKENNNALS